MMTEALLQATGKTRLSSSNKTIQAAWGIAVDDLISNIKPYQSEGMSNEQLCIMAGHDYTMPWTRDAAINSIFACSLMMPETARTTLLAVLEEKDGQLLIGGEYWDKVIWIWGAWHHWLTTRDYEFIKLAYEVGVSTMLKMEEGELDLEDGLFRGPGWDGVSGYPEPYTTPTGGIKDWVKYNEDKLADRGVGIPIKTLSTNCLYYQAYICLAQIQRLIRLDDLHVWKIKAADLKKAINKCFWSDTSNRYRYLCDPIGHCEDSEGLGQSYAVLFGIADQEKLDRIFHYQHICSAGLPAVWPDYDRYRKYPEKLLYLDSFDSPEELIHVDTPQERAIGRHCLVWPVVQAMWARAAASCGKNEWLANEMRKLATHAVRDGQFAEIYHSDSTEMYGGLQEVREANGIALTKSCVHQTWSATGFLNMILHGVLGIRLTETCIKFEPCMIRDIESIRINDVRWLDWNIDFIVQNKGVSQQSGHVKIDIVGSDEAANLKCLPVTGHGSVEIRITS
ncbi:hypothetical protein JD969_15710 [Planctomycetota bacterium]|nr:hypothetical protein JD969_15710 [Planctomycetota bacterium]